MIDYDALISETRDKKFNKLTEKKETVNEVVCNFDEVNGHVEYKDGEIIGPCLNRGVCELHPMDSRYKSKLESDRVEARSKEEIRSIKRTGLVICNKKQCKLYGNVETCQHGIIHQWSESCTMQCNRFKDSRCGK